MAARCVDKLRVRAQGIDPRMRLLFFMQGHPPEKSSIRPSERSCDPLPIQGEPPDTLRILANQGVLILDVAEFPSL